MLPGRDGLSVLRQLREQRNHTPVLLLSARGQVDERVEGLNAGADDYLPKPFALAELIARVRSLGRRGSEPKSDGAARGRPDAGHHHARGAARRHNTFELTTREYRLLEFLMRSAGRICGRMAILEKVWDYDFDPGTNLVDVYVKRLREKIDEGFESQAAAHGARRGLRVEGAGNMTVRARMTLWYASILFVSVLLITGLSYHEFVEERTLLAASKAGNLDEDTTAGRTLVQIMAFVRHAGGGGRAWRAAGG